MALDKLVDSSQLDSDLTSVANAIRAKSGGSGQLAFPAGFVSEIGNISGGGIGDMTYSTFTFTPTQEYGRVASGGLPNSTSYIISLLPSGWRFARVRHKSGTPDTYFIGEIGVTYYYVCAADAKPFSWVRRTSAGAWESVTITNSNPSTYGAVLSPNCVYEVEVLSGPLFGGA